MVRSRFDRRDWFCYAAGAMGRWVAALRLTGVGFFIGGAIALGVFGGHWLDGKLDTCLFWIIGLILGVAVAFYGVYQMLLPLIGNKRDGENSQ